MNPLGDLPFTNQTRKIGEAIYNLGERLQNLEHAANLQPLHRVRVVTTSDTLTRNDHVILVDASAGAVTITLPAASLARGHVYRIEKMDAEDHTLAIGTGVSPVGPNMVTIVPAGADLIDGRTSYVLTHQFDTMTLAGTGTGWYVLESARPQLDAWAGAIALHLGIPRMKVFYPMGTGRSTTISPGGGALLYEYSGDFNQMTKAGTDLYLNNLLQNARSWPSYFIIGTQSWASDADTVAQDPLGDGFFLTFWVRPLGNPGGGSTFTLVSKWTETANQRTYRVLQTSTGAITFEISTNGSAVTQTLTSSNVMTVGSGASARWNHVAVRIHTGTELAIFLNGVKTTVAIGGGSSIGALFNSNAAFGVGGHNGFTAPAGTHTSGAHLSLLAIAELGVQDHYPLGIYYKARRAFGV